MGKTENDHVKKGLNGLIEIIQTLRGDQGCPWDRKQTPETMWKCLIEEVYELLEAIEKDDAADVCDELGDVLFQLVFIAELYRERGAFDIFDAISKSAQKMIRRHPHVYADLILDSEEALFQRWEKIKGEEKKQAGKLPAASALDSVPSGMTALLRSYKISERAVRSGFDWDSMAGVIEKVEEEWKEFTQALATGDKDEIAMEFGDILFTLSNVARFAGIHPETALARSTEKFEQRFRLMETLAAKGQGEIKDLSRTEKDSLWDEAKKAYDNNC
ncbi:tetrapyrrole methylase family protein (MazG family protein) [Desulforapulum autotrophicum HRM2]|uniref:Tetrapyrrole methylase family protein (MazG family protein) n=1 Tax=Desulforapulum autotrophicum (strain ATCC 43914 / DSM 3382 / VKM B-1955 / HRM2) TaxID=177437 RepID=C0Q9D5_DESAH|nr:nucleoside triphosphate pyrophosphohydrolase [Desulforapulum autotrophicum]ACN16640.1 tetrapyrrole methylase family protein (MazG family protein) [Desulforapulum autotrophicum HRM2]